MAAAELEALRERAWGVHLVELQARGGRGPGPAYEAYRALSRALGYHRAAQPGLAATAVMAAAHRCREVAADARRLAPALLGSVAPAPVGHLPGEAV